jgi:exosome complex RNA-binding protein Rrp4
MSCILLGNYYSPSDSAQNKNNFELVWVFENKHYSLTTKRFDNLPDASKYCKLNNGKLVEFTSSKQLTAAFRNLEKVTGIDSHGRFRIEYSVN